MITRNRRRLFSRALALLTTAAIVKIGSLNAATFQEVLKNPRAYDHQRVSVVGVVRGDGPEFYFYQNANDAKAAVKGPTFLVVGPDDWKGQGPYDMRKVRITGRVDARRHGFWGHRATILLEKIEVLSDRVAPPSSPFVVFCNEGSKRVSVHFGPAGVEATFDLDPKERIELPYMMAGSAIKVFSPKGALIVQENVRPERNSPYYDKENAAYFYRITDSKIERVLPSEAKSWGWRL
jgi:hypothetical protein